MHGLHTVRFDQTYAGLPVLDSMAAVRVGPDGAIRRAVIDVARDLYVSPQPTLDAQTARRVIADAKGQVPDASWKATLAVRPDRSGGKLVWQIDAWVAEGPTRFEVDAHSGAVLRSGSLLRHATGRVYEVNKVKTPTPADKELLHLTASTPQKLTGAAGTVTRYVSGDVESTPIKVTVDNDLPAPDQDGNFLFDPAATEPTFDDGFAETNVYYHLDRMNSWVQTKLGVDTSAAKWKLMAVVNYGPNKQAYDNAAFVAYTLADDTGTSYPGFIVIGQGSKTDFAYDSDVFLHEYTHYINHNAIGFSEAVYSIDEYGVITSPGTIDEGTADYFSSTVNDDPVVGEASLSTLGPYARDLEGDGGMCPDTMYGETHEDGKLIGTAAWAVRKALGADVADPLIWGAMSMLPKGTATLGDFAKNVMEGAQDLKTQGKMTDAQIAALQAIFDERGLTDCFRELEVSPTKSRKTNMIGLDILGQMMGASCSSIRNYGIKMTSLFHFKYQPKAEDKAIRFKVSQKAIMGGGSDWKWTMYARKGQMVTFNSNPMTMSTSVNEYDYEVKDIKTADGELVIDATSNPPFDPTQSYSMVIMHQNCPTGQATVSVVAEGAPQAEPQPEAGTEDAGEDAPTVEQDAGFEPDAGDPGVTDKADDGGCGCRTSPARSSWGGLVGLGLAAAAIAHARRRR